MALSKVLASVVFVFMSLGACFIPTASQAVILETAATSAVLGQLKDTASGLIEQGRQTGDFLIWRLGITVRDSIDAFEKSGSTLIDQTFDRLDATQREFFHNADALMSRAINEKNATLEEVRALVATSGQMLSTIIVASKDPYVMFYDPRVLVPGKKGAVIFKLQGPNLGNAHVNLLIGDKVVEPKSATVAHEVVFELDRADFVFKEKESSLANLSVAYDETRQEWWNPTTWFGVPRKKTDLVVWLGPQVLATYSVDSTVHQDVTETKTAVINIGSFSGRNTRIFRAVPVPDLGDPGPKWRLDLAQKGKITLIQGGADRGRCEGIDENSLTANGLTMFARVDNRDKGPFRKDGWVDCSISLPLIREVPTDIAGTAKTGSLSWVDDTKIQLDPGTTAKTVNLTMFDGGTRVLTGAAVEEYLSLEDGGEFVVLRPNAPRDF